eukprot:8226303-Heterocapsa_arctica.AAC.1
MNVSHQFENGIGRAELARLTEQIKNHALMSEGKHKLHASLIDEQQSVITAQTAWTLELESMLEVSAHADESGVEELKQHVAELTFGLETGGKYYVAASAANELRAAEFMARIETFENEAKSWRLVRTKRSQSVSPSTWRSPAPTLRCLHESSKR